MKTQNPSETSAQMDKQALLTYGGLSFVIYSLALAYCYSTDHFMEAGIMGAVMIGLGFLIASFYSSVKVKSKKHETPDSFKQAA